MVSCRSRLRLLSVLLTRALVATMLLGAIAPARLAATHGIHTGLQASVRQEIRNWTIRVQPTDGQTRVPLDEPVHVTVDAGPPSDVIIRSDGTTANTYPIVLVVRTAGQQARWLHCPVDGVLTCTFDIAPPARPAGQDKTATIQAFVDDPLCHRRLATSQAVEITWAERPVTPNMTWAQVKSARTWEGRWHYGVWVGGVAWAVLGGVGGVFGMVGGQAARWAFGSIVAGLVAVGSNEEEIAAHKLANDPVDTHFTVIASPVVQAPPQLPPMAGVNGPIGTALNALMDNVAHMTALTDALVTAVNRAQGALKAQNAFWAKQQMFAAAQYAQQAATLISAEPALLTRLEHAVQVTGVRVAVTTAAIQRFRRYVAAHGLPASITQPLTRLGVHRSTLDQIRQRFMAPDPQAGPGRFPDMLTDPQLLAATRSEADALRQFAAAAAQGPRAPAAVGATAPAGGTLRAMTAHLGAMPGGLAEGAGQVAASGAPPSCKARPPAGAPTPTAAPSSATGDLQQDGPITVTVPPSPGYTVDTTGARSLNGTATVETPYGTATYAWTLPARIPKAGTQGTLTLTSAPGRAGRSSNLAVELWVRGEVDSVCAPRVTSCTDIQAYGKSGKTATATATFTIKARDYSVGRTTPVLVIIGCAWNGPTITIPYRILP